MASKYQIFVSSTFRDLCEERDLVIKAILEMGHIPVGMEMFSAADEEQWGIIKKQIDQSDYYVVIVAHRYGSCDEAGLSYTEKEYDYAVSRSIPTLGFIVDEGVTWPKDKSDGDRKTLGRLTAFKNKIKLKPVSFWRNGEDLYGRCSIALVKAFNTNPREGWVRASQVQDAAAAKEIVRLSSENAELRNNLKQFHTAADEDAMIVKIIETLRGNKRVISVFKKTSSAWETAKEVTLYQIFETLAPEMQVEVGLEQICQYLATNIALVPLGELRTPWPTPRNATRSILADLAALGCVTPSTRRKPVSDKEEYWSLSPLGAKLLAQMRRRRLEKIESLKMIEEPPAKDKKSNV